MTSLASFWEAGEESGVGAARCGCWLCACATQCTCCVVVCSVGVGGWRGSAVGGRSDH